MIDERRRTEPVRWSETIEQQRNEACELFSGLYGSSSKVS